MSISDPAPPAPAQVELASRMGSIELSLVAADFRPIATGVGRLSAVVPAGIYQVVARAGPVIERRLIRLEPGATYRDDDVAVSFPSAAPVTATSTSHEYHQSAAEQATQSIASAGGEPSGLVIVVRDVRGYEGPPLEARDLQMFTLRDSRLVALDGFSQAWRVQPREAVATWSRRLPPGGYALRTDPALATERGGRPTGGQAFDQSIWLSDGWQTVVFLTIGPAGARTSEASVHVAQLGIGWSPHDTDVGHALELANWGLREGRSVVPDDLLNVLLGTKFVNPMLGIVAAHSLLLRQDLDLDLLRVVIDNLETMVAGHPDVVALRWLATSRGAGDGGAGAAPAGGAAWPTMLLPGYRALIEMDAAHPNAIADGSVAERVAANLLVQGIWTSWRPLPDGAATGSGAVPMAVDTPSAGGGGLPDWALEEAAADDGPAVLRAPPPGTAGPVGGTRSASVSPPPEPAAGAAADLLGQLGRDPSLIELVPASDPATARVAGYLTGLAALEGSAGRSARFSSLSTQEIGLATTLPAATVNRALANIAAAVRRDNR